MDNYEINILRRSGNWKKVKPGDLINDEIDNNLRANNKLNNSDSNDNFNEYITKVESIIIELENLENEKNNLKDKLKICEDIFLEKKKITEDKINKISKEKDIIDKTINVIKNLKSF